MIDPRLSILQELMQKQGSLGSGAQMPGMMSEQPTQSMPEPQQVPSMMPQQQFQQPEMDLMDFLSPGF